MRILRRGRGVCLRAALTMMALLYARPTPAPTLSTVDELPSARTGACLASGQDGKVYNLLGKRPSTNAPLGAVDVYDTRTGRWTTDSSDPVPGTGLRVGATATLLQNGDILIAGGLDPAGRVVSDDADLRPARGRGDEVVFGAEHDVPAHAARGDAAQGRESSDSRRRGLPGERFVYRGAGYVAGLVGDLRSGERGSSCRRRRCRRAPIATTTSAS